MKTPPYPSSLMTACLLCLSAAWMVHAADYTATGQVISGQAPSLVFTNASGQVLFRANVHTAKVISTDARMTGRRRISVNGYYNADGTATLWGACQQEMGTWTDATFSPGGGVWDIQYSGTMGVDNSLQLHLTGQGYGGGIDGFRLDENLTRGPAPDPNDVNEPYHYSGSILPAPVNTRTVLDNFDTPPLSQWSGSGPGQGSIAAVDGTLKVHGYWPGTTTRAHDDTYFWAARSQNWSIPDGRTLEWRVELVSLTGGGTNAAAISVGSSSDARVYLFYKGTTFIELVKWSGGPVVFSHDNVAIKDNDVVLSLSMTRIKSNLILTARVLDMANHDAVLYERTIVDTPKSDPSLSQQELRSASGMNLSIASDPAEVPIMSGDRVLLDCWQYTDGTEPAVDVVYDNLELRSYDTPQVGIERSVSVLTPEGFDVEKATTPGGPWSPILENVMPGLKRVSTTSGAPAEFFRAVPKP